MWNDEKEMMANQVEIAGGIAEDRDLQEVWLASRSLSISLACSVFFLILFAWLSEEVFEGELQRFDLAARIKVHEFFSPQMTKFMQAMTFLGSIAFLSTLFLLITAFWLSRKMYRPAAWLAIAVGGSVFLDVSLKLSFHRARPVPFVGVVPLTYSFPSGHALSSFCFYGVLAGLLCARIQNPVYRALIWSAGALLVLAIGISRIYLGVHYPTDVIAGYAAAAAWVSTLLLAVYSKRKVKRRIIAA
ncbi:MAG TPA: phosphatase PAP2 family protein [Candidatus Saccharimonadales bacterium]|jgi:undecaprenyl-diphosphatase|nr:phosphatase PAP2 family protein [Candidatus Saccharimonadales bacterium]